MFLPSPPSRPREQLSGGENGLIPFGADGLCRFDVIAGQTSIGAYALSSTTPASPWLAHRDYWWWRSGATPWPDLFELHPAPQVDLPSPAPEMHGQRVFSGQSDTHDLSSTGLRVWRLRRAELVGGQVSTTDLGHLTRDGDGVLTWYADTAPALGYFVVPQGTWLRLQALDNTNLVVQGVLAVPGTIG